MSRTVAHLLDPRRRIGPAKERRQGLRILEVLGLRAARVLPFVEPMGTASGDAYVTVSRRHIARCDEFDTSSVLPANDTAVQAFYRVANDTGKRR